MRSFLADQEATYPQPLREIIDRNSNISQATELLGTGDSIENEWNDFLSNWDSMAGLPLSTLSQAINLAPSGSATAVLPHLSVGDAYNLSLDQLTAGFSDPDGDTLSVPWLSTDHGDWFSLAANGSWQLDPNAPGYDASYLGPLELSYSIDDGHGHSIAASQLLVVVDHVNNLPSGTVSVAVVGGGAPIQYATLQASNSLTDADLISTPITYSWYCGSTFFGQGNSIVLGQAQVGQAISVQASYTDGNGTIESVSSAATAVVANVDDAPTGSVTLSVANPPKLGDTVTTSNDVADLDGIPSSGPGALLVQWQSSADGLSWSDIAGATSASLVLGSAQVGKKLRAQLRYTDLWGAANTVSSSASATVVGVGINWTGTSGNDSKSGTSWDDTLNGAAGSDKLTGLAGHDWLDGGAGIDTLAGGLGNDTYVVDNSSDLVTELTAEGYDTVLASVSYSLLSKAANVEALMLTGSAAINGTGNTLDNSINGNNAANVLNGGAGNDSMTGGGGNDTYVVDSPGDVIVEASGGGIDLVQSSISCSLAGLLEVENLTLTGSAVINATGNGLANVLTGNSAANVLDGGAGNDSMTGGGGNDTLAGGKGSDQLTGGLNADVFRFDTAPEKLNGVAVVDIITDYSIAQGDRLELSSQAFTTLTGAAVSAGLLAANAFLASSNGTASTSTQRILYNTSTGSLSYDPDGSGSTAAQAFAKLSAGLALSADQVLVSNLPLGL
ncbi:MAG: cadherin-like domain-containing protein [Synechococcaceae cyanobacterium]